MAESSSLDTMPVTGSLIFVVPVRHLAAVFCLCALIECNDCFRTAVCRALWFLQRLRVDFVWAMDSDMPAGARSGITFDVTLEVPWNAPEAYVQLHSEGVFKLEKTIPDVLGLCDRWLDAAMVRVMQGRDARSVHALIPDPRVLERGFIVDMENAAELAVSEADLSLLRRQWPVTPVQNMTWVQNELDDMRAAAKKRYRHLRPGDCSYCGTWIKCDMYRHVSTFHLDLGQLWWCQVSWCSFFIHVQYV